MTAADGFLNSVRLLYALAYVPVGSIEEHYMAAVNTFDAEKISNILRKHIYEYFMNILYKYT